MKTTRRISKSQYQIFTQRSKLKLFKSTNQPKSTTHSNVNFKIIENEIYRTINDSIIAS